MIPSKWHVTETVGINDNCAAPTEALLTRWSSKPALFPFSNKYKARERKKRPNAAEKRIENIADSLMVLSLAGLKGLVKNITYIFSDLFQCLSTNWKGLAIEEP